MPAPRLLSHPHTGYIITLQDEWEYLLSLNLFSVEQPVFIQKRTECSLTMVTDISLTVHISLSISLSSSIIKSPYIVGAGSAGQYCSHFFYTDDTNALQVTAYVIITFA